MDLASTNSDWLIRTSGDPFAVVPALKQTVSHISGNMVMFGEQSMGEVISNSLSARRFTRLLLGSFAVLALVLAAVGIYGVVSYTVTQATQEIGVRMALGAEAGSVLKLVVSEGLRLAGAGAAIGLALAAGCSRMLQSQFFGASALDPITLPAIIATLLAAALLASYIPARRAARVDPLQALRHE
jgi:putative ABC transport system permease protein